MTKSSSPIAVQFQDWFSEDLLPTLRKQGYYTLPTITQGQALNMVVDGMRILETAPPWERFYDREFCNIFFTWFSWRGYWDYLYNWMTPDEIARLNAVNPVLPGGDRKDKVHMSIDAATKARLEPHVSALTHIVRCSGSKAQFQENYRRFYGTDQKLLDLLK